MLDNIPLVCIALVCVRTSARDRHADASSVVVRGLLCDHIIIFFLRQIIIVVRKKKTSRSSVVPTAVRVWGGRASNGQAAVSIAENEVLPPQIVEVSFILVMLLLTYVWCSGGQRSPADIASLTPQRDEMIITWCSQDLFILRGTQGSFLVNLIAGNLCGTCPC